jgi:alkaline phosphatase
VFLLSNFLFTRDYSLHVGKAKQWDDDTTYIRYGNIIYFFKSTFLITQASANMIFQCNHRLSAVLHIALTLFASSAFAKEFKNVIIMIPDGCGDDAFETARWYKGEPLKTDEMDRGSMRPIMANSIIADSAPGGTALASGFISTVKFIGVGPRLEDLLTTLDPKSLVPPYFPAASIMEAANTIGKGTGMISTSSLSHATPGSFAAHVDDRSKTREITLHQVFNHLQLMMGGGRRELLPAESCPNAVEGGRREDCRNLEDELRDRGYELCQTKDEMDALVPHEGQKVWCSFAINHMAADIDRKFFAQDEPSLAEMSKKAIEIMSMNPSGFVLMIEGAQPDWAGHANDVSVALPCNDVKNSMCSIS